MDNKSTDDEFQNMVEALNGISPNPGNDSISKELDTMPVVYQRNIVAKVPDSGLSENTQHDYKDIRNNLHQLIADGQSGIEGLLKVAVESESPRAYEVLATYLKTVGELNSQLIELHQSKAKIETEQAKAIGGGSAPITNNNVFVGSTEDLQQYLEARK